MPNRTPAAWTSTLVVDAAGIRLDVTVVRKRIRRIYLGVHPPDGRVIVSAPVRAPDASIRAAVLEDLRWVVRHRERILDEERRAALTRRPAPSGRSGETWWVFGAPVPLEVTEIPGRPRAALTPDALLLRAPSEADDARRLAAIERWQRRHLRAAAAPLVATWSRRIDVDPRFIGIRRMRTHWGTCEPQERRIWLALELVARPIDGLEYVIVHELVHLIEASHGPRFVRLMDAHLPDWRQRRSELDAGTVAGSYAPIGLVGPVASVDGAPPTGDGGVDRQLRLGLDEGSAA